MKFTFMLLPWTLGLLACTQADMAADSDACRPADQRAMWQIVTPGIWSTGPVIIPRKVQSGGSSQNSAPGAGRCIRHRDDPSNPPQIRDLQKIGYGGPPVVRA
jgi:hypothetical protein